MLPRTSLFDSRSTWNVQYIAASNLWDAKHNGTTTFMFDRPNTWNVIYIVRSNRIHRPTSPNTVAAPKKNSHDWSLSHMKRHLQCVEQLHRKKTLIINPCHIWNAIYNARSNRCHPPTSPYNTVPATKKDSHDCSSSHTKRQLQCAEQQVSSSNVTKYCACREKWFSRLIFVTYETLFTMRGATEVIPSNITKYYTCQEKWLSKISKRCGGDPTMIRDRSDHDPRMKLSVRNPHRNRGYNRTDRAFCTKK